MTVVCGTTGVAVQHQQLQLVLSTPGLLLGCQCQGEGPLLASKSFDPLERGENERFSACEFSQSSQNRFRLPLQVKLLL